MQLNEFTLSVNRFKMFDKCLIKACSVCEVNVKCNV